VSDESIQDLIQQRDTLRKQVFPESLPGMETEKLRRIHQLSTPVDPVLHQRLEDFFSKSPKGKKEYARMEIDWLRRASRSRKTEQIVRAFGVLEFVTPLYYKGTLAGALWSGPLKAGPWRDAERSTLSQLAGKPGGSSTLNEDGIPVFAPEHLEAKREQQQALASVLQDMLSAPSPTAPASSIAAFDPQPGFAGHMELLFQLIQTTLRGINPLSDTELHHLKKAAERGRLVARRQQEFFETSDAHREWISLHELVENCADALRELNPALRFQFKFKAENDRIFAPQWRVQHLLTTLLASVADGLPEGQAVVGVSSRVDIREDRTCFHLEIRDYGGLATFAGLTPADDRALRTEQDQLALEFGDWVSLASHLDASLSIHHDEEVLTRVELFLPYHQPDQDPSHSDARIWIVEDVDEEYERLEHMLRTDGYSCQRFHTAAEIRKQFSLAAYPPDLVILKYHLPDQRGAELRSWLFEQDPDLPVVLTSSFQATHPGIATANSIPSTLYLQKPYDSRDLLDILRLTLDDTLS